MPTISRCWDAVGKKVDKRIFQFFEILFEIVIVRLVFSGKWNNFNDKVDYNCIIGEGWRDA